MATEHFIQRGEYLQTGAATVRLVNTCDIEARATAALSLAGNFHPGRTVAVPDPRHREARPGDRRACGR